MTDPAREAAVKIAEAYWGDDREHMRKLKEPAWLNTIEVAEPIIRAAIEAEREAIARHLVKQADTTTNLTRRKIKALVTWIRNRSDSGEAPSEATSAEGPSSAAQVEDLIEPGGAIPPSECPPRIPGGGGERDFTI